MGMYNVNKLLFKTMFSAGEVYLKEGFELDYETTTQYQFELTIKDEYHSTTLENKFLTIVIADVNEAPYWPSALDPVSADEGSVSSESYRRRKEVKLLYPKLYNMAHLLALNVLLLPKDLTIIFICYYCSWCCAVWRP